MEMDTYSVFREIADSWGLLGMMMFFIVAVLMLFRPGAKQQHIDASQIPFRDEPCKKDCSNWSCSKIEQPLEGSI
jgi:cytochrome c oxidase cbb3-type subunit 4